MSSIQNEWLLLYLVYMEFALMFISFSPNKIRELRLFVTIHVAIALKSILTIILTLTKRQLAGSDTTLEELKKKATEISL